MMQNAYIVLIAIGLCSGLIGAHLVRQGRMRHLAIAILALVLGSCALILITLNAGSAANSAYSLFWILYLMPMPVGMMIGAGLMLLIRRNL